jgi:hypothetical protein
MAASVFGWVASAGAATDSVTSKEDSGSGSLRAVIASAGSGDTITFAASLDGETIHLTSGVIGIDKSLTIEGPGPSELTVDAGHDSQVFTLTNGSLSISGLTLTNGAALNKGGAIYTESAGSLTLSDCTFIGNTAGGVGGSVDESNQGHGGAIYVSRSSGPTSISDSTFNANAAGGAGGTGAESGLGSGGAIWDGGEMTLTVSGSSFTGNTAGGTGGGGEERSGNGAGGAIQKSGGLSLAVSDSTFTDNTAGGAGGIGRDSGHGFGGAIYVSQSSPTPTSLSVEGSSFGGNAAGGTGGNGPVSGSGNGGAIAHYGEGQLTVSGATFEGNSAGGAGGAGGTFIFGEFGSGGGRGGAIIVAEFAGSTSVSGSLFAANTAGGDGGSGSISGRGEGGAIEDETRNGPVTVTASTFTENTVGGQHGGGGGSGFGSGGAIRSLGSLTVVGSTFAGNAAGGQGSSGFGGAISNFDNASPLTITGSTFASNTAGGQGGGGSGGAIDASSVSGRSASITDSTLVGNAAGGGGAAGHGGAIEVTNMNSVTLSSVTIDENEVGAGGSGAGINSTVGAISRAAAVTAKATIVSENTGATNCDAPAASSSYSLEGPTSSETSCSFDLPSADPLLEPLADNGGPTETQALPASSPAVDAVPISKCPTKVDQRGEPRPDNGKGVCDVGAYELQDPPIAPAITSAPAATFQVGKAANFTINATGLPVPDLSETGALPVGVVFADHGDGTASLAGTSAPGTGGSYPITIKASNGAPPDAEQSFTLTVQAPPTASIAIPVDGATYTQNQAINASFACADGASGPGIASCVDQDGSPSGASLDTAATGRHTFTVTATSKDGLTSTASVAYRIVQITPKAPPPPRSGVLVSYRQEGGIGGPRPSLVVFKNRRARVMLGGCTAKFALGPVAWRRLRTALRGAHLHAIAGDYLAAKDSADAITYVIKAGGDMVRIAPPQPQHKDVMHDLRLLLKALNRTVSAGKRQMPSHCKSSRS